jgi:phospholipase D1/2
MTATDTRRSRATEIAIVVAVVLAGLGIIAAIPWLRHAFLLCLHGDVSGLRTYIRSLGAGGVVLVVSLMVVHALIYYPTELVTATAGFVYGWKWGIVIALGGWLLSALASYALGRRLAGPLLRSLLGRRFSDLEAAVQRGGTELLLGYRLLPVVPFSLLGYVCGAIGTPLWTFSWTSVVGFIPETAAVVYLGSQAKSLSFGDPVVWIAVVLLIACLAGGHLYNRRRRGPSPD